MSLTFICLTIAIHGDALRCANNPGGYCSPSALMAQI